jgi:hypothetical protein
MSWVLGYISGLGSAGIKFTESDNKAMQVWITNYCQANPLKHLKDAADGLAHALETMPK